MIDLEIMPPEMREQMNDDVSKYGEWLISHSIYLAPLWKMISELKETDTDIVWFVTIIHMINFFNTQDPNPIHFVIAREQLENKKIFDHQAIDSLARELVTSCQKYHKFIGEACSDKEIGIPILMRQNDGYLLPCRDCLPNYICERNGCNFADFLFSEFLKSSGKTGIKAAKAILKDSKNRFQIYKDSGFKDQHRPGTWDLWIKKDAKPSVLSPVLGILADVAWEDQVRKKFEKQKIYRPAIPTGIWSQTFKPVLKKSCRIESSAKRMSAISDEGRVIASIKVPLIDGKLLSLISRGFRSIGSLSGHRLFRWEIKSGCQNIINGVPDSRFLITEGGYEGITHLIGCGKSPALVAEVKAILHAQAHAQFHLQNGDKPSSLIILTEMDRHRNKEPNKIKIILGDLLLPNALFHLPQGEQRRLIPITDLPPLVGSTNTHAAQAMLQLLILEEFSRQSDRLIEKGSAYIPLEKWLSLSREATLPDYSLQKVINGWISNDLTGTAFLQKDGEEYTLSKAHSDVLIFLEDQGKRRILGAEAGKNSAKKVAIRKKRILRGRKVKAT